MHQIKEKWMDIADLQREIDEHCRSVQHFGHTLVYV